MWEYIQLYMRTEGLIWDSFAKAEAEKSVLFCLWRRVNLEGRTEQSSAQTLAHDFAYRTVDHRSTTDSVPCLLVRVGLGLYSHSRI